LLSLEEVPKLNTDYWHRWLLLIATPCTPPIFYGAAGMARGICMSWFQVRAGQALRGLLATGPCVSLTYYSAKSTR
jgi:hypothetical protein